jgi:hypothetical protein
MAEKAKRNSTTADTAPQTEAAPQAAIDSVPNGAPSELESPNVTDTNLLADASTIEPTADGSVDTSAVAQQQQTIGTLQAAISSMPVGSAARLALEDVLVEARGMLALLEAQAESEAAQAQETSDAIAAAAAFNLSDSVLASMLAAIDSKYAPAPIEVEPQAQAEPLAVVGGRKPLNPATVERNATVAQALSADATVAERGHATIGAFNGSDLAHCTVRREAGTRFASVCAFASNGAGVANKADYVSLATAIRMLLAGAPYNLRVGGQSTASVPWLSSTGPHAAGAIKGNDSLRLCFADRREVALYPDGRFRLALPGTAGTRPIRTDAGAYALFVGGSASDAIGVATVADSTPSAAHVPTPPTVQQMQAAGIAPTEAPRIALPNGGVTSAARCQHCTKRNLLTDTECSNCGAADWRIA